MTRHEQLRIGVLGCSDIAWRRALPAMTADPSVRVVTVASRSPSKAARFAERFDCRAARDYADVLDRADVDAVYVPLPPALHLEWVGRALRAGKHVLAEKPLAVDARSATEMLELARAEDRVLLENFMFQFHSQHERIRKLAGPVREFAAAFTIPPLSQGDIRHQPELGGGALLDVGGYPIRSAMMFLGADLSVAGATLDVDPELGVDMHGTATLRTPDGRVAELTFGMRHAYRSQYQVTGESARITLDRAYTPPADHVPVLRSERDGATIEQTLAPDDQWANVVRAFASAALGGERLTGYADLTARHASLVDDIRRVALDSRSIRA
jgi:dTDP-3,4-didehydro-2,6-dideoxy-alpha-D-glucose 3-reductase